MRQLAILAVGVVSILAAPSAAMTSAMSKPHTGRSWRP